MDKAWIHNNPVNIIGGKGSLSLLPSLVNDGTWLLVTTEGFTKRGITQIIRELLELNPMCIHDRVTPNPSLDDLDLITERYRGESIKGIIALGGGSVLDTAKVLSLTLLSEIDKPMDATIRQDNKQIWHTKLKVIAIPTTSGTGAEVTPFATIWDKTTYKKYSLADKLLFPDIAILDPELTLSLPYYETLCTGLDAISHALESLWNKNKTLFSEIYAYQALSRVNNSFPEVLKEHCDFEYREKMQQASLLSGLAISQTRTAIAHSISYPLTSYYNVPHGLACGFTLPLLIDINMDMIASSKFQKEILIKTEKILDDIDIFNLMNRYVSHEDIQKVKLHMVNKERFDNYNGYPLDIDTVINQLNL